MKGYIASASVTVLADASRVWAALTTPELIREYLFGTEVTTDWRPGSPITYRGDWKGTTYEDKGVILEVEPNRRLVSTYWSSMGGLEDLPENYNTVAYELAEKGGTTVLTVTQDNNPTEDSAKNSASNWEVVLSGLKALVEKGS